MLVLWKILRMFVNTLTDDDKCSPLYRDNLTQSMPILLSQKQKTFTQLLPSIFEIYIKF